MNTCRKRLKVYRGGAAAIELVLVIGSFVVAVCCFWKLGEAVLQVYFRDGNQAAAMPFF